MPRPSHFFDCITRKILGEEYRSLSSSFCGFLHSPVSSSLLGPKYSQHSILKNPQATFNPQCTRPSFSPIQKTGKIIVL
jgi:hypothetical protein